VPLDTTGMAGEGLRSADYAVSDVTAVYGLRAHADNPWVIERLRLIAEHYDPLPRVQISDFGSEPGFARKVRDICERVGFGYNHVPDHGLYSASAARNRGFERVSTDLVFFCDIDTFGPARMFADVAQTASAIGLREIVDIVVNAPIVHLSERDTARFTGAVGREERSGVLDRLALEYLYCAKSREDDAYVAPYSNNFLIHRNMFSMAGGYDESFRGHGSEDFEFLARLHLYTRHLPTPQRLTEDLYGPMRDAFYRQKDYAGFRRLFEAMSYPAEVLGFRVFHLWHPRDGGDWRANNDWRRDRFNKVFANYVKQEHRLLSVDAITRPRKALCVCKDASHWGYFVPLRLAGFELMPLYDDSHETIAAATDRIISGEIAAFAIFNPYMTSHQRFKPLFDLARDRGLRTIIIERGALPASIYYADDVALASAAYAPQAFAAADFSAPELVRAAAYVEELRLGTATLERQDGYDATAERYAGLPAGRPIIFIPIQLDDDTAVTRVVRGGQSYADFVADLPAVIAANPDMLFVVKPHLLSASFDMPLAGNLVIARREDNIHALLDVATMVIDYNSGAGLLGLLHGKPVVKFGNPFYNYPGAGHQASSLAQAVARARETLPAPGAEMVARLAAWFLFRKYSTFIAVDGIRDHGHRKSHAYRDIQVTHFRWESHDIALGRQREAFPLSNKSYIWARIGLEPPRARSSAVPRWGAGKRALHLAFRIAVAPIQSRRDNDRLRTDPIDFFGKARHPLNRFFGRLLLEKSQRAY
jgi:predicted glycosyltransferase involved in capsule biosynthesis